MFFCKTFIQFDWKSADWNWNKSTNKNELCGIVVKSIHAYKKKKKKQKGQSRSRRQTQMCATQFGKWPNLNKTPNSLTFYLVAFKSQTKMFNVVKLEVKNEWSRFSLSPLLLLRLGAKQLRLKITQFDTKHFWLFSRVAHPLQFIIFPFCSFVPFHVQFSRP